MDRFVNEYEMTEDLYIEQYAHDYYLWLSILLVFACFMFAISGWWIIFGLSLAYLLVICFFAAKEHISLKETYQKQLRENGNIPYEIQLEFLPTTIRFVTNYGADETLPYSAILKSYHKQNLIVFVIDRGYHIAVKKDAFSEGSLTCFVSAISVRGL